MAKNNLLNLFQKSNNSIKQTRGFSLFLLRVFPVFLNFIKKEALKLNKIDFHFLKNFKNEQIRLFKKLY